jgi:DNA-binding MarR family transcriptional regulator
LNTICFSFMSKQQIIHNIISLQQQFDQIMVHHRLQHWMTTDLTTMQFKCLLYIVKTGVATSVKLAGIMGVTPADVTRLINRLIKQDLVQRQENPQDRRFFLLQATLKGKQLIEKLNQNASDHFTRVLDQLSEEELQHLYIGLSALSQKIMERLQSKQQTIDNQFCGGNHHPSAKTG